jgi:hypothetical protein
LINLLSLIPFLQSGPTVSTDTSAPFARDFSALLTELVGPVDDPDSIGVAATPQQPGPVSNTDQALPPAAPESDPTTDSVLDLLKKLELLIQGGRINPAVDEPGESENKQPTKQAAEPSNQNVQLASALALLHFLKRALENADEPSEPQSDSEQPDHPTNDPRALLADVKKFELTIRRETRQQAAPTAEDAQAAAVVTSDPIANLRQIQLPPRLIPVRPVVESKPQARAKNEQAQGAGDAGESKVGDSALQQPDASPTVDRLEQPIAAQPVEIPNLPKLQVVRTVAMEVGDEGSHIIIRIEDRGGNMNLHFGAGDDTMRHSLQSSMETLVNALKRERIDVSSVEVSRKSPIDKVRRMKEALNG